MTSSPSPLLSIAVFILLLLPGPSHASVKVSQGNNDLASNVVANKTAMIKNLWQMDQLGLFKASLPERPWSGGYWPLFKGMVANRYADPLAPKKGPWKVFRDYSLKKGKDFYIKQGKIALLSPAEKYDLLVGDAKGSLEQYAWEEGRSHQDSQGKVEEWLGICFGWAAASIQFPRPLKMVRARSWNGTEVEFFPADIKALASLLWDQADYPIRLAGGRCLQENPTRNVQGRLLDPACFDNNPGTWHMAVVNQIGVSKKGLIMDADAGLEVWNQPLQGYSLTYFNPITLKTYAKAILAAVPLETIAHDRFRQFRGPAARRLVGVHMRVTYVDEADPRQRSHEGQEGDQLTTVTYSYDLELDDWGNITGGEWHQGPHPDFLWVPGMGAEELGRHENQVKGGWHPTLERLPSSWKTPALEAGARGLPLYKIVEELVTASRNTGP